MSKDILKTDQDQLDYYMENRKAINNGSMPFNRSVPTKSQRVKVTKARRDQLKYEYETYKAWSEQKNLSESRRDVYTQAREKAKAKFEAADLTYRQTESGTDSVEGIKKITDRANVGKQIADVKQSFAALKNSGFGDEVFERPVAEPPAPALPSAVTAAGQPDAPSE